MSLHFCYSTTALETYFLSKLRDFLLYCPKRLQGFCLPYFELEISRLYQFQTERSKLAYHLNSSAFISFAKHIERIFQRKKIEQTHKSQGLRYQIKSAVEYLARVLWELQHPQSRDNLFCHCPLAPAILGQSVTVSTRNPKVLNTPLKCNITY